MGIWDAFTGKKSQPTQEATPEGFVSSSEGIAVQPTFDAPTSDDIGSFISQPGAFDPAALHPLNSDGAELTQPAGWRRGHSRYR